MFTDSITVVRYPTVVDHGRAVPNYAATPVTLVIPRCDVQPGASVELLDHRDVSGVQWTVFAPANADVNESDLVTLPGDSATYSVIGRPDRWGTGADPVDHVVVLLQAWKAG